MYQPYTCRFLVDLLSFFTSSTKSWQRRDEIQSISNSSTTKVKASQVQTVQNSVQISITYNVSIVCQVLFVFYHHYHGSCNCTIQLSLSDSHESEAFPQSIVTIVMLNTTLTLNASQFSFCYDYVRQKFSNTGKFNENIFHCIITK